jgi:hypothetical protein
MQKKRAKWWQDESGKMAATKNNVAGAAQIKSIDDLPKMYTVKEVAQYFKVNIFTVYGWRYEGLIEPSMQGRSVRFTAQQIEDCRKKRAGLAAHA